MSVRLALSICQAVVQHIRASKRVRTMNKKWAAKRITVNLASNEAEKLEKFCSQTGRPATDVIRELIRRLPVSDVSAPLKRDLTN